MISLMSVSRLFSSLDENWIEKYDKLHFCGFLCLSARGITKQILPHVLLCRTRKEQPSPSKPALFLPRFRIRLFEPRSSVSASLEQSLTFTVCTMRGA